MKVDTQLTMFMMLIFMITTSDSSAQGLRQRRSGGRLTIKRDPSSTDKRQDVEGTIWEFKVMESNESNKSKRTRMTGRIRIKQSSVFSAGKVEQTGQQEPSDKGGDQPNRSTQRGPSGNKQGELKGLLSQRINKANELDMGGERIGDMTKSKSSEKTFQFDEDDEHPLSGIVVVKPDTTNRNGVWLGRYDEFSNGKKKKRWRFEMRKIEE